MSARPDPRHVRGAVISALLCAVAVAGAAQEAPRVDGTALLGHLAVADVVAAGDWTWSLGTDGVVVAWRDGRAVDWALVEGATHLALDGDRVGVLTPTSLATFAAPLADRVDEAFDGTTPCRGGAAAWAWTSEPPFLVHVGPAGRTPVAAPAVPPADARCTVAGSRAALAWDDAFGAIGATTDGDALDGAWFGDAHPLATFEDGAWRILRPDEVGAGRACDVQSDDDRCPAPDPDVASAFRAPELRVPIGAALHDGGLVVADRGGWTAIRPHPTGPTVTRFVAPVVAFVEGDHAVVVTCTGTPRPRVAIVDPMGGTELAAADLAECPVGARRVAGRLTVETTAGTLVLDSESGRLVDAGPGGPRSGEFAVDDAWSAACAGIASSVVDSRDGRRVFGPSCAPIRLVDVRDSEGRRAGAAVCGDAERPIALLRLDGGALDDAEGTCAAGEFRVVAVGLPTEPIAAGVEVQVVGARARIVAGPRSATVLTTDAGIVVQGADWIWVSPELWHQVAWWSGDTAHTLSDPATEAIWSPGGLDELLSGAQGAP